VFAGRSFYADLFQRISKKTVLINMIQNIIIFLLFITSIPDLYAGPFQADDAREINSIKFKYGNSPLDNKNFPQWANDDYNDSEWDTAENLMNPQGRKDNNTLWFRMKLPDDKIDNPAIFIPMCIKYKEVYLYNRLILAAGDKTDSTEKNYDLFLWHIIPLKNNYAGKTLTIKVFSDDRYIGMVNKISIGSNISLIKKIIKEDTFNIILTMIYLILGIFSLIFFIVNINKKSYLGFSICTLSISVYSLVYTNIKLFFIYKSIFWAYSYLFFLFLIPVGLSIFIEEIINERNKYIIRILFYLFFLNTLITPLLVMAGAVDFFYSRFPFYFVCIIGFTVVTILIIKEALKKNRDMQIFLAGFIILFISNVTDTAISFFNLIAYIRPVLHIGMLLFVISMVVILGYRFSEANKKNKLYLVELEEINKLKDKLLIQYRKANYKNLQKRMNPHFLFNAIHTIYALMKKDLSKAENAIIKLSEIYRFLTDRSFKSLIPFREEWEFMINCIDFYKINYSDTILFDINLSGNFDKILIPPLTIQPLAENSVKHGMSKTNIKKLIRINARKTDSGVIVEVLDNGSGLASDNPYVRTLGNIRDRLKFHYEVSDLKIHDLEEGGVRSVMSFTC
jgi:sensor histidine kinase YesM